MTPPPALAALRRAADRLAAVEDDIEVAEAGKRLGRWLADGGGSLDDLFGLTPQPGAPSWRVTVAIGERDRLLRLAAEQFGLGPAALATALKGYATGAWLRERGRPSCPERHRGRLQGLLWQALTAWPVVPGERQMRRLVGHGLAEVASRDPRYGPHTDSQGGTVADSHQTRFS